MKPKIKEYSITQKNGNETQEFIIQQKDYGRHIFYDVLYNNLFLISLNEEGKLLIVNRENAQKKSLEINNDLLEGFKSFIMKEQKDFIPSSEKNT